MIALYVSAKERWGHKSQQKLHSQNEPPTEMQGICWKEETFPSVMQGKTTVGIILQVCALPRLFRCQNDILPSLIAEQKATRFKTKNSDSSFFSPRV